MLTSASIIFAIIVAAKAIPNAKHHFKPKHYVTGAIVLLIAIDTLTPPAEATLIISDRTISKGILTYFIPYSGGEAATCPLINGYSLSEEIGATVLVKKTRIIGLCTLTPIPAGYAPPKFGDWRSI